MKSSALDIPFVWPDSRRLVGDPGPVPDIDALLAKTKLVFGVVHGLTSKSVARLAKPLKQKDTAGHTGDEQYPNISSTKVIRLIVALYPTCPTNSDSLLQLLQLQKSHTALQVRLVTCGLLSGPQNTLAFFESSHSHPTVLFGSAAQFEDVGGTVNQLTLGMTAEPILTTEWIKWFDVRWHMASPLTEHRIAIPHLVLPEGTKEADQQWQAYEQIVRVEQNGDDLGTPTVDTNTGELSANDNEGESVPTPSPGDDIPRVSPVFRNLADLFTQGHLVSVDKTTRLPPFEVPVKPKWFGLETLKQIGSVKRQVSYHISALTDAELKQLENRRKKTGELLEMFSFSLADGQRWMPCAAETLFQQEHSRINAEAKDILTKLIADDLPNFMAGRRATVREDANRMYRDLIPGRDLSTEALDEIMNDLQKRFEVAQQRSFLPQLSFNRVSLPQPQASTWKSELGSALHLLLSIIRYPRKACREGAFFARGMKAKPAEILSVMNLLDDPFVKRFAQPNAQELARNELVAIDNIQESDMTAEDKCRMLFELIGHKIEGEPDATGPSKVTLT